MSIATVGLCVVLTGTAVAVSAVGCGSGASTAASSTTERPRRARVSGRAAPAYSARLEPIPVAGIASGDALERVIDKLGRQAGLALRGDGRLSQLAAELASDRKRRNTLGPAAQRIEPERAAELGLFEAELFAHRLVRRRGEPWPDALVRQLPQQLRRERPTHYGLFVEGGAGRRAVFVSSQRRVRLAPVPRVVAVGEQIVLRGELDAGLSAPSVRVHGPGAHYEQAAGAARSFDVRLPTPEAGRYHIALVARGEGGPLQIAQMSVRAGTGAAQEASAAAAPVGSVQQRLAGEAQRARAIQGLSRLSYDAGLQRIADKYVERLDARPTAPQPASIAAEVKSAGLDDGLVLHAVIDGTPEQLISMLNSAPGARALTGNPHLTHLAIGVAPAGRDRYAAFLLGSRLSPIPDTELAPAALLSALNRNRRARGSPPLAPDRDLSRAARFAASAFFADATLDQEEAAARGTAALDDQALRYRRVETTLAVVRTPVEAAALEPALEPDATRIGIGIALGDRPDTGPRAVAVALVLAVER